MPFNNTEWAKNYLAYLIKYWENTKSHIDMKSLTQFEETFQLLLQEWNVSSLDYTAGFPVIACIIPCSLWHAEVPLLTTSVVCCCRFCGLQST